MAGKQRRYRYQVIGSAVGPPIGVTIGGLLTDLSPVLWVGLGLGIAIASVIIALAVWWLAGDSLRANGWEW